jgi:hypothetical protein
MYKTRTSGRFLPTDTRRITVLEPDRCIVVLASLPLYKLIFIYKELP